MRTERSWTVALALAVVALAAAGCGGEERVEVPGVRSASFEFAYSRLHDAGLRVRIEEPLTIASVCAPLVRAQRPTAGTRVAKGSVVTLVPDRCWQGLRSWHDRSAVVPDFRGGTPGRALEWAMANEQHFELRLEPLDSAAAPSFYENYRVVSQQPAAGATLRPADRHAVRLTPLVVVAQAR